MSVVAAWFLRPSAASRTCTGRPYSLSVSTCARPSTAADSQVQQARLADTFDLGASRADLGLLESAAASRVPSEDRERSVADLALVPELLLALMRQRVAKWSENPQGRFGYSPSGCTGLRQDLKCQLIQS